MTRKLSPYRKPSLVNVDITEHKQAERALKQAEEKFAKAFLYNPVALTITRISDGRYLEVNEAFYQLSVCL